MDQIDAVILKAVNKIELECEMLTSQKWITREQANRRVNTARSIAEILIGKKFKIKEEKL